MEALAALGVAAAALQFLTFSLDTLELFRQIRDDADGATFRNVDVEDQARTLKDLQQELHTANLSNNPGTRRILNISKACEKSADDLSTILQDVKGATSKKRLDQAKALFRAMRGKKTIERLQNKLKQQKGLLDSAISIELLKRHNLRALQRSDQFAALTLRVQELVADLSTRQEAEARQHSETRTTIELEFRAQTAFASQHHAVAEAQSAQRSAEVRSMMESGFKAQQVIASEHHADYRARLEALGQDAADIRADIQNGDERLVNDVAALQDTINSSFDSVHAVKAQDLLLSSLFYPEIELRKDAIKPPCHRTFTWVFKKAQPVSDVPSDHSDSDEGWGYQDYSGWSSLPEWLETGSSIYWINGKAGSGKSTLMAYISQSSELWNSLKVWSPDRPIYVLSFFLWRPGTILEKSVVGLLRSLLYQLCKAIPSLAGVLSREFSFSKGQIPVWTESRLAPLLQRALTIAENARFCVFIDGLDEFEGDKPELIDLIFNLQSRTTVKCCVFSRPELPLADRLAKCAQMRLEDLNRFDIDTFVRAKLRRRLADQHFPDSSKFLETISFKAEGVFLWAALVSEDVVRGLDAGDDAEILKERLCTTPAGIEALLSRMLADVDHVHRRSLTTYLQILRACGPEVHSTVAEMAAATIPQSINTYQDFLAHCSKTWTRLVAQSKGLISLVTPQVSHKSDEREGWCVSTSTANSLFSCVRSQGSLLHETLSARSYRRLSIHDIELMRYYLAIPQFVHRSAYDFLLSEEAERILGSSLLADSTSIEAALLGARSSILAILPSEGLECPLPIGAVSHLVSLMPSLHPYLSSEKHDVLDTLLVYLRAHSLPAGMTSDLIAQFWEIAIRYRLWNYLKHCLNVSGSLKSYPEVVSSVITNFIFVNLEAPCFPWRVKQTRLRWRPEFLLDLLETLKEIFAPAGVDRRNPLGIVRSSDNDGYHSTPKDFLSFYTVYDSMPADFTWQAINDELYRSEEPIVTSLVDIWKYALGRLHLLFPGHEVVEIVKAIDRAVVELLTVWDVHVCLGRACGLFESPTKAVSLHISPMGIVPNASSAQPTGLSRLRLVFIPPLTSNGTVSDRHLDEDHVTVYELSPQVALRLLHHVSAIDFWGRSEHLQGKEEGYSESLRLVREDVWQNWGMQLNGWQQLYLLTCLRNGLRHGCYDTDVAVKTCSPFSNQTRLS